MAYVRSVRLTMTTENCQDPLSRTEKQTSFADITEEWEETCKNCHPLTPTVCVTSCNVWNLKREFRKLHQKMKSPNAMTRLLNTLKNKRRLQILEIITKGRYSALRLQQELKKLGYYHSQSTITEEYLVPLMDVGLVQESQDRYYSTVFGHRLAGLMRNFRDIESFLPPHSECYEEAALSMLLKDHRTYDDFENNIPAKSVPRVLKRLQAAELIETAKENDYVFYFRTKRDPLKVRFSPTERRAYENIPVEGVSATKLARETKISLRRTYKYLKKLKGKKMVFTRKRPKSYALTLKGIRIALMLEAIRHLTEAMYVAAAKLVNNADAHELSTLDISGMPKKNKTSEAFPMKTLSAN